MIYITPARSRPNLGEGGRSGLVDFETPARFKAAVRYLDTDCGASIVVSSSPNSMHGRTTIVCGILDGCAYAKNTTKLAWSRRERGCEKRGCVCDHTGECKYACHCERHCKCKYWRDPDLPSRETVRKSVSGATVEGSLVTLRRNIERAWKMLVRTGKIRPQEVYAVAFDKTAKHRSAKSVGLVYGKYNGKAGWHEVYMTAQLLADGKRLTIAVVPMDGDTSDAEAIRMLLAAVKRRVPNVTLVIGDKAFCTTEGINEVKAAGLEYTVAHPHSKKTDKVIDAMEKSGAASLAEKSAMHGKGGTTEYRLRAEHSRKFRDGKWKPADGLREKYIFYAASDGEIDVTLYADRWGIETGYRQIDEVRARTASRSHGVRVLYFIFAIMVCNVWVLLNEVRPAVGAHRHATLQTVAMILHGTAGDMVAELQPPLAPPDQIGRAHV